MRLVVQLITCKLMQDYKEKGTSGVEYSLDSCHGDCVHKRREDYCQTMRITNIMSLTGRLRCGDTQLDLHD